MAQLSIAEVQKAVKDSIYVSIGLAVIAFQKAQVRRNELQKQVEANLGGAREAVEDRVKTVEERLEALETRIDALLDDVEERLPEQARIVVHQAREVAKDARTQLRELASRSA